VQSLLEERGDELRSAQCTDPTCVIIEAPLDQCHSPQPDGIYVGKVTEVVAAIFKALGSEGVAADGAARDSVLNGCDPVIASQAVDRPYTFICQQDPAAFAVTLGRKTELPQGVPDAASTEFNRQAADRVVRGNAEQSEVSSAGETNYPAHLPSRDCASLHRMDPHKKVPACARMWCCCKRNFSFRKPYSKSTCLW
jgi:hypothetical protein